MPDAAQELLSGPRVSEAKAVVVAERRPIWDAQRAQRKRERRCFWTRPIGHIWDDLDPSTLVCRVCGKRESSF